MTPTTPEPEPSAVTQSLIDMLRQRDAAGKAKYGTSLDRTDLTAEQWIQHATEELLDAAGYLQSLARTLRQGPLVPQVDAPPPQPAVRCFAAESGSQWAMTNETEGVYFSPQGGCWPTSYTAENLIERFHEITYADALARLADRPEQAARLRAMGGE